MSLSSLRKPLRWLHGLRVQVLALNTYKLIKDHEIEVLSKIDERYQIRKLGLDDAELLQVAYSKRATGYFHRNGLPRLASPDWVALAVIDTESDRIAYVSWIIQSNVPYLNDIKISLRSDQRFVKDGYCVPTYRHQGLHTRMEQERINFCVAHGAREIFIQIATSNTKGIRSVTDNGFAYYQTNKYVYIPSLGIFHEMKAFVASLNPLRRVITND